MTTTSVAILVPTGANQLEVAAVITKGILLKVATNDGSQWNDRPAYVGNRNDLNRLLQEHIHKDDYDVTAIHYIGEDIPPVCFMEFPWEMRILTEYKFQFDFDDIPSEVCATWVWDRLK